VIRALNASKEVQRLFLPSYDDEGCHSIPGKISLIPCFVSFRTFERIV
jgi:hypothetical protein